jgi:phosphatidylinositol-3-phosphatase
MKMHRIAVLLVAIGALISSMARATPAIATGHSARHHGGSGNIQHVFIIVLENEGFEKTFGANSEAPYLSKELRKQGVLLTQYFGIGHASLDNYIAMISGQAATAETRSDCQTFTDVVATGTTADGQIIGNGCVYPPTVQTLAGQLEAKGKSWRGYMEDMGNDPKREPATCAHPAINARDATQSAEAPSAAVPLGDQYAARHNPFVYFHSIIDSPACATDVVSLGRLPKDLESYATTPNLIFITPNLCNDGHDEPCKDGQPGGLTSADQFLRKWVPIILASPAYKRDGLLIITFDEGDATPVPNPTGGYIINFAGDVCCSEQPGPNIGPFPQSVKIGSYTLNFQNFGGDRTGTVLLSRFLQPGTVSRTPFNHYSLLKSLEDIFGVGEYLGYAAQPGLIGFFGCATSDIATRAGQGLFGQCMFR